MPWPTLASIRLERTRRDSWQRQYLTRNRQHGSERHLISQSLIRFHTKVPYDRASDSSHSERPLITASAGYGRYDCRMQIRSPKPSQTRRPSAARRSASVFPIESRITILRHQKVILDNALAELYGTPVKRLNQQVNRNRKRFPSDFMFQLTPREFAALRLQFATSNKKRGGRRSLPYAFTEHGAIMAATVLNSDQAVEMSVFVVRAFVRLRAMLAADKQLAARIEELEEHLETHDGTIQQIINVIKKLMNPASRRRSKIGFALPTVRTG